MTNNVQLAVPSTVGAMEEVLVAWQELWWRSPGGGASPFASDGPWHLMLREIGDFAPEQSITLVEGKDGRLVEMRKVDTPRPRTPLGSHEVVVRDQVGEWIEALDRAEDRRVLMSVAFWKWRGVAAVPWTKIAGRMGDGRSTRRLAGLYREALARLLCRANGLPERHWKRIIAGDALDVNTWTLRKS